MEYEDLDYTQVVISHSSMKIKHSNCALNTGPIHVIYVELIFGPLVKPFDIS